MNLRKIYKVEDKLEIKEYCCKAMEKYHLGTFMFAIKDGKPYAWMMHPFVGSGFSTEVQINFCPFCGANIYE